MDTEGSGASRGGGEGLHNEDAFLVEEGLGLYVVCDGASQSPAGELAARIAVRALEGFVEQAGVELRELGGPALQRLVQQAMTHATRAVVQAAATDPGLEGLSTTVTMLLVCEDLGVIGHRGDSRAYLIRHGRAHQLTEDHALADVALPDAGAADFEVFALVLEPGDTVVLCTDGAEAIVQERTIVRAAGDLSPRMLASRIVSAAHRDHPDSDATAVVVRVRGAAEPGWLELSELPHRTAFGHTLERA